MLSNRPCPYRVAAQPLMEAQSQPPTENATAGRLADAVKSLSNTGVQAVEALIIADVPWLGWPGIKQAWELVLGFIASYIIKAAQNGVTFAVIDVQVDQELSALSAALKAIQDAQKSGDPIALKKAIQAYADAQSALVHSDGSHHAS
jgi:hypothetical protein